MSRGPTILILFEFSAPFSYPAGKQEEQFPWPNRNRRKTYLRLLNTRRIPL
jgi:hypothetical protein